MITPRTTAMIALRTASVLLCLLSFGISQAAERIGSSAKTPARLAPPSALKYSLVWLRDLTLKGFLPTQSGTGAKPDWDNATQLQFDVEHQLFKPVNPGTHDDTLKNLLKQDTGFKIGPNTHFQCDLTRYWTVNDQQDLSVKLGVQFGFR